MKLFSNIWNSFSYIRRSVSNIRKWFSNIREYRFLYTMACHIICFVSFRFVSICFVSFCFFSFRFVSFRFYLFRFVSICFVSFSFVSVSFRTLQGPLPDTWTFCTCIYRLIVETIFFSKTFHHFRKYSKCAYGPYCKLTSIKNGVYIIFYIWPTLWVSLLVDQSVPEGTCTQVLLSTSVDP